MIKEIIRSVYYDLPRMTFRGRALPCRNLVIELTYRCNLKCQMCSIMNEIEFRESNHKDAELKENEIIDIIDQLPENSNVTFTGGEIFLKKGIEEIIKRAAGKHRVTIATNGLLLAKHAEMVLKTGVKSLGVSLDGPPKLHNRIRNVSNAFEQLNNGLQTILEYKNQYKCKDPSITVNSVILKDNYSRLPEVVKIVKDIGLSSCSFQILDLSLSRSGIAPNGNLDLAQNPLKGIEKINPIKLKASLLKIIKEGQKHSVEINFAPQLTIDEIVAYYQGDFNHSNWRCSLPWNTMRISPYGDVYPCLNLFIGNVKKNKLKELWNHTKYFQFRQNLKKASLYPACIGCCKKLRSQTT